MVFMHALDMKELLIGVKWYMNESDKNCSLKFLCSWSSSGTNSKKKILYLNDTSKLGPNVVWN